MKRILSLALCLILCLTLLPAVPAFAAGEVAIDETNFPDENVRSRVKAYFDTDGNGKLSSAEIKAATDLTFGPEAQNIISLKGIELLTELKSLSLAESKITELDFSGNPKLEQLDLWYNAELTKLTVSSNPNLVSLTCYGSSLSSIDVSKNTKLTGLSVTGNKLTKINLSKNTELIRLEIGSNQITKLDLSHNTKLTKLNVSYNQLTKLDLSHNTKLKNLSIIQCGLDTVDVRMCPALVANLNSGISGHSESHGDWYRRTYEDSVIEADSASTGFRLLWNPDVTVITQPANQTAEEGSTVIFSVVTSKDGTPNGVWYQWYYRKSETGYWYKCSGSSATSRELKVSAKMYRSGYQYRCKVWAYGTDYTRSDPATLTVTEAVPPVMPLPVISAQPQYVKTGIGMDAVFSVEAEGESLSYQWQYMTNKLDGWKNCTDGTAATLTVTAKSYRNCYQYRCQVTNPGGTVISDAATLHVVAKPVFEELADYSYVQVGETARFGVLAEGEDLSYQWYYRKGETGGWYKCTGESATTDELLVVGKLYRNGYQYRCKISNISGSVYSTISVLYIG